MHASLRATVTAAMALFAFGSAEAANLYVNPDGVCGGNLPCFTTIQAAHTAAVAGDMIIVQPATYTFAAIMDITKSVAIIGPQANVNPNPSSGSTRVPGGPNEAIVEAGAGVSGIFRIRISGVEINGLELRGSTIDQVQTLATTPTQNLRIAYNIMHVAGDEALQLRSVSNSFVECNHIFEVGGEGINLCCNSVNTVIRNNEVDHTGSIDGAITTLGSPGAIIEGNFVHDIPQGSGIQAGSTLGADVGILGTDILANRVRSVGLNGISVLVSGTDVLCNEVTGARGTAGVYSEFGVSNNTFQDNFVHDNTLAIAGPSGGPAAFYWGAAVNTATMVVSNNSIQNNVPAGMFNYAGAPVDARLNWWGDPTGPSGAGPGAGDLVGPNIMFLPFLVAPPSLSCQSSTVCQDRPTPVVPDTWGRIKSRYR